MLMKQLLITLLALLPCAMCAQSNGEALFGYDMGNANTELWGTGKAETYDVAMHLDGAMFKGKTINGFVVPLTNLDSITDVKAWLTSELQLQTVDGKTVNMANIASVDITQREAWVEMRLEQPYLVPDTGVYAGLTLTTTGIKTNEGKRPIVVTPEPNSQGFYVHTSRTYRRWQSIADELNKCIALKVILGGVTPHAAAIAPMAEQKTMMNEPTTVSIQVKNHGSEPISAISLTYSVAGITNSIEKTFNTPIPAQYEAAQTVQLQLPAIEESNVYALSIIINKVNGVNNTDPSASVTGNLIVYGLTPKHRPLVEEYTGTWCGNCPRGLVGMEEMTRRYPNDFVGISIHNNDPMEVTTTYPLPNTAFPNAHLDRMYTDIDPYTGVSATGFGIESVWLYQCETIAPAAISVAAHFTDNSQSALQATATVTFPLATESVPYRIAYVLLADSLRGTTSDWAQANYYSGTNAAAWEVEGMREFCQGSSKMFVCYNDVMIAFSDFKGVANSMPAKAEAAVPIQHSYTFSIANIKGRNGDNLVQNKKNLRVVAMLVDQQTGYVVNANKAKVETATGIEQLQDNGHQLVRAYYTADGKRHLAPQRGLNMVKLADGTIQKIFVR
ncbi:MAG: hypothetical protein J5971_03820 [Prevotella sp.]|nr:hypothetical protein [Prevotella sp.]